MSGGRLLKALLTAWLLAGCDGTVEQGARAFAEGDLEGAIEPLQAVAETGRGSGVLHYNLGNAWYRKGELPRAVAHYRVAQLQRPRDGRIHHNLAVARADLGAERTLPEPVRPPMFWMAIVTPSELGALGLLLTITGSMLALRWRREPGKGWGPPAMVAGSLGVLLAFTSMAGAWQLQVRPIAVASEQVSARDLPRVDAEERHLLPAGAEIQVLELLGDFALTRDGGGRRGWVSRSALLLVDRPTGD